MFVKPKRIEIIRTNVPGLSSLSQVSCEAIKVILKKHYLVRITTVNTVHDLRMLVQRKPDLVFNGIKYLPGKPKLWVASYLKSAGIAHTGSPSAAVLLEQSKPLAKQAVQAAGINTSSYIVVPWQEPIIPAIKLQFPLFVKPTSLGGGQGIDAGSVVTDINQLQIKVGLLTEQFTSDVLIEEYLPGREFSVAILRQTGTTDYALMPIELIAPLNKQGNRLLGQATKSANQEVVVSVTDLAVRKTVNKLALDVFKALGARDYGRIDIRLDSQGQPHFLEANLIPSLITGYGSFPKACLLNNAIGYKEMILRIVELGLEDADVPAVVKSHKAPRVISAL